MNSLFQWLQRLSRPGGASPSHRGERVDPDKILESIVTRHRNIDPETPLRWKSLEHAIGRAERAKEVPHAIDAMRPLRIALTLSGAAAVVVITLVVWPRGQTPLTYHTGKGELSTITLADSTEVRLNHTSEVTLDGASFETTRHVTLRGEAYFHVRKNGRPFRVSTSVADVQVFGTEFDVRVRGGRMDVGVLTGKVAVSADRNGRDSTVILVGGELTTCASTGFPQSPVRLIESGYPGWIHGKLTFFQTSVMSVCNEIESKFNVVIRVDNPELRQETITGALDVQSVNSALHTLAELTGTSYRNENGTYILY